MTEFAAELIAAASNGLGTAIIPADRTASRHRGGIIWPRRTWKTTINVSAGGMNTTTAKLIGVAERREIFRRGVENDRASIAFCIAEDLGALGGSPPLLRRGAELLGRHVVDSGFAALEGRICRA